MYKFNKGECMTIKVHVFPSRLEQIYTCGQVIGRSATAYKCTAETRSGLYWLDLSISTGVQFFE
jgi:hypothetical protein